jgi:prophage regulatory protein
VTQKPQKHGAAHDAPPINDSPERFMSKPEVCHAVDLSYPTIWKKMREGEFPRSRELGTAKVGWIRSEIDEWIRTRPVRRLKGDPQK